MLLRRHLRDSLNGLDFTFVTNPKSSICVNICKLWVNFLAIRKFLVQFQFFFEAFDKHVIVLSREKTYTISQGRHRIPKVLNLCSYCKQPFGTH